MTRFSRGLALLLLCCLLPLAAALAQSGQTGSTAEALDRWESEAVAIERTLEFEEPDFQRISEMRGTLQTQLDEIAPVRQQIETRLAPLRAQLEALGEAPADPEAEAPQIAQERQRLQEEVARLESRAKRADQARARAEIGRPHV